MKLKIDKEIVNLTEDFGDWFLKGYEIPAMTQKLYPYKKLFSPIRVNNLTIKNRLVMGPMGNISMCEETGRPNEKMLAYFEARAKGGVGLITTGLVPTTFGIDPTVKELGDLSYFPRIDRSRTVYAGWRDLAANVHSHGAAIFIQLTAGLGRVGNPQCLLTQIKLPVSASWNPNYYIPQIPCKRLSGRAIKKIIKKTGQAAADAKAANLDGVYLHGHEGYLIEQLTNPAFNRRKIGRYSSYEVFGIDMVKEIRERCGEKYPIMYRIDLSLALNETYGNDMKNIKSLKKFTNGRSIQQTLNYMKNLVAAGVDMFDVDLGCYDNWWLPHPPSSMPAGCFLSISEMVKKFFKENNILSNQGLEVPIVAVGKLGYPDLAEKALRDEKADMIMLARPLLADPEWPNKAFAGKVEDITPCIGCQEACINEFVEGGHPQCAVCPRTAFEDEFPAELNQAEVLKKVAVVGAGPAGVTAAATLIRKGHSVDLYETQPSVGGILNHASKIKIKYEIKNYLDFLKHTVEKLTKNKRFKLFLNTKADVKTLKDQGYDVIIIATGSKQIMPKIEGVENKNVCDVVEFLKNPDLAKKAKNVVVVGGGDSGCEVAYYLKYELKKDVDIVELRQSLMNHTCTANRGHIIYYLKKGGVKVHNCSSLKKILAKEVLINKNISKTVPDPFNTWQPILPENIKNPFAKKIKPQIVEEVLKADLVIMAMGTASENKLYGECVESYAAPKILNIGDSFRCGRISNATKAAYRTAVKL